MLILISQKNLPSHPTFKSSLTHANHELLIAWENDRALFLAQERLILPVKVEFISEYTQSISLHEAES